jgi:cation:H+ antiporter
MLVWFEFALCLILIAVAGYCLSLYGDMIGEKLGLSRSWIGVVMVASVTSLPELVNGVSSVTVAQTPDIAAGDVLGSCVFNLLLIVILDFLHREEPVYTRANIGHVLSAGFGVILIGFVGISLLLSQTGMQLSFAHVGLYTPIILVIYALAMRIIFRYEQMQGLPLAGRGQPALQAPYPQTSGDGLCHGGRYNSSSRHLAALRKQGYGGDHGLERELCGYSVRGHCHLLA